MCRGDTGGPGESSWVSDFPAHQELGRFVSGIQCRLRFILTHQEEKLAF